MRGVSSRPTAMHLARASALPAPRAATVPQTSSASLVHADPLRTLDARVRELERWVASTRRRRRFSRRKSDYSFAHLGRYLTVSGRQPLLRASSFRHFHQWTVHIG